MTYNDAILILAIPVAIILNIFLYRRAQIIMYKKEGITYTNPMMLFAVFMGFIGTIIILMVIITFSGVFDYKPKK